MTTMTKKFDLGSTFTLPGTATKLKRMGYARCNLPALKFGTSTGR